MAINKTVCYGKEMWIQASIILSSLLLVSWQQEIAQIEEKIKQLRELQEKYQTSVEKNINNAMRWQFQNQNYLDARKAWDKVAQEKQKIQELEDQIGDLQSDKQKILKENNVIP